MMRRLLINMLSWISLWSGGLGAMGQDQPASPSNLQAIDSAATPTATEYERLMEIARLTREGPGSRDRRIATGGRPTMGAEDAALVIVEIGSFDCPFCRRHWVDTMPEIRDRFIDSGAVRYVFVDVALDPRQKHAQAAAEAALCAHAQGNYVAFRDHLHRLSGPKDPTALGRVAAAVELDLAAFQACVDSGRFREQVIAGAALGRSLRVRGTPTFFLGWPDAYGRGIVLKRRFSGLHSIEEFAQFFESTQERQAANDTAWSGANN